MDVFLYISITPVEIDRQRKLILLIFSPRRCFHFPVSLSQPRPLFFISVTCPGYIFSSRTMLFFLPLWSCLDSMVAESTRLAVFPVDWNWKWRFAAAPFCPEATLAELHYHGILRSPCLRFYNRGRFWLRTYSSSPFPNFRGLALREDNEIGTLPLSHDSLSLILGLVKLATLNQNLPTWKLTRWQHNEHDMLVFYIAPLLSQETD